MKVKLKAPIYNAAGLFKKGDVIDVEDKDFDVNIMEPAADDLAETTEQKKAPAKTTAGRKKKA